VKKVPFFFSIKMSLLNRQQLYIH